MTAAETMQEGESRKRGLLRATNGHWFPRWLAYSRLAEVMKPSTWLTFMALVMLDHQCMGLNRWRRDVEGLPPGAGFAVPASDIVAHTGMSERTVMRRAVPELLDLRLLTHYVKGSGGRGHYQWPQFAVAPETLIDVFVEAGPALILRNGGFADIGVQLVADEGVQIYGHSDKDGWPIPPGVIIAPWPRLNLGPRENTRVDLDKLRYICGIDSPDKLSDLSRI